MSKKSSIEGTAEAWESGALGRSDAHARRTSADVAQQIDDALGLQASLPFNHALHCLLAGVVLFVE